MLIVGICGSSAASGRTRALIDLALEGAARASGSVTTAVLDLASTRLQFADGRSTEEYDEPTRAVLATIRQADAYVIGSPMYRGSMTGALKNLLDLVAAEDVVGKAVALVATGGTDHHYLGFDLGLRTALASFRMHTVPGILYGSHFTIEDGRVVDPELAERARNLGGDVVALARGTNRTALGPPVA